MPWDDYAYIVLAESHRADTKASMEGSRVEPLLLENEAAATSAVPGIVMLRPLAVLTLVSAAAKFAALLLAATNVFNSESDLIELATDMTNVTFADLRATEDVMEMPFL